MNRVALLAVTGLLAIGCGGGSSRSQPAPPGSDLTKAQLTAAQLSALASADNAFGGELLARVVATGHGGNVVLSPASIATALQMTYVGARGRTAAEMARVLRVTGQSPAQTAAAATRLMSQLAPLANDDRSLLDVVNALWVQSGFTLTPAYAEMMRSGFGADLHRVDFVGHPATAVDAINKAVESTTHGRIKDLVARDQVDGLTRLVLTNAIYLKARWAVPFEKGATSDRDFFVTSDAVTKVPTMERAGVYDYAHGPGYQAVRLPYAGGRLVMTVVLPAAETTTMPKSIGPFHQSSVDLYLPKWSFDWSHELTETLSAMGMPTAFGGGADFSGISTREPLHISFVQHKAFIKVDENGTEAAAATAIGMETLGLAASTPMHVNRPFFFTNTDTQTGLNLFAGRVTFPE
jgi:serpin B